MTTENKLLEAARRGMAVDEPADDLDVMRGLLVALLGLFAVFAIAVIGVMIFP